jgi:hypothetical protein
MAASKPAPATVIYNEAPATVQRARRGQVESDELWLTLPDLAESTGWELKPEGVCRDDICILIPPERAGLIVRDEGEVTWFNLTEFARQRGQAYAHDADLGVWYFGAASEEQQDTLSSLAAPDFTLPDLEGNRYSLSDFRGKKVLLLCWASW